MKQDRIESALNIIKKTVEGNSIKIDENSAKFTNIETNLSNHLLEYETIKNDLFKIRKNVKNIRLLLKDILNRQSIDLKN